MLLRTTSVSGAVEMATLVCNLQKQISALERNDALAEGSCRHCGKQAWMLQALHKRLEVCGQEFMVPLALGAA